MAVDNFRNLCFVERHLDDSESENGVNGAEEMDKYAELAVKNIKRNIFSFRLVLRLAGNNTGKSENSGDIDYRSDISDCRNNLSLSRNFKISACAMDERE